MPRMIDIIPNPKPSAEMQKHPDWAAIVKRGRLNVDYVTAKENVKTTGGMYMMVYEDPPKEAPGPVSLEDMPMDDLKVMMLSLGVKTEKKMKRADVIALIRTKMDEVEIEEDE